MRLDHKVVTVVSNPKLVEHPPVYILDKYISKLPEKAMNMDLFRHALSCLRILKIHGLLQLQLARTHCPTWYVRCVKKLV